MNIHFVPFKVITPRYNALMPAVLPILKPLKKVISCDLDQFLLRCSFLL